MPQTGGAGAPDGRVLKRLIARSVTVALVAAIATAGLSLWLLKNQYRAGATLLVAPIPISMPEPEQPGVTPGSRSSATSINYLMVKPLSVLDYKILLMSDEIVGALLNKAHELASAGSADKDMRLEDLRKTMTVRTEILKQTMNDVEYQPVIQISVEASSPDTAAALANEWAKLGVALAEKVASQGKTGLIEFLRGRFDLKSTELGEVEQKLEELRSKMVIEISTRQLEQLTEQATKFKIDLRDTETMIASTRGRLEQLRKQLETVPEFLSLRKAPPDEAYWLLADKGKQVDSSKTLVTEEVSSVHEQIRKDAILADAELQGLLAKKAAIEKELEALEPDIGKLQTDLAAQTRLQDEAKREYDVLTRQHTDLAVNFGAAEIAEAQTVPDLKIASEAIPPERKVGPHRSLLVLAAGLLGFLVVPVQYLALVSFRSLAVYLERGGVSGSAV